MSWRTFHLVDAVTGIGTGASLGGDAEFVALNVPAGQLALPFADFDHRCQRVEWGPDDFGNAVVPMVVAYQPPAPADTEWQTWAWDADTQRYVPTPTLAQHKRDASQPILAQLVELDAKLVRPLGEMLDAIAQGLPPPADSALRLSTLNAEKAALRQLLAQIEAATTLGEFPVMPPPLG